MSCGIRTTLNNVTIDGVTYNGVVDLAHVFHPRGTTSGAANVGFRSADVRDLSDWFYPLSAGGQALAVDTGLRNASGTDLRQIYAAKGTVSDGSPDPGGGGGGCLPFDTPVMLWAGGSKALGELRPGDVVIGYFRDGMLDADYADWSGWTMPRADVSLGTLIPVTVVLAFHGEYPEHYLINGELRATYEHHWLATRDDAWMWLETRELRVGDCLLSDDLTEVPIESVEFVAAPLRIANIDVEEVDNYLVTLPSGVSVLSHNSDQKQ